MGERVSPEDRKYASTHEWVKLDGDEALIGITDHAQKTLGDITFIELPAVGEVVRQGEELGTIESVKAASDLFAPLTGTVSAVNSLLVDKPETVNEDPYGEGWMVKLSGVDKSQLDSLMSAGEYDEATCQ